MTVRIEATRLIPGEGPPLDHAVVISEGATISYAGPAADAPKTADADTITATTVMPGMWDSHTHLVGLADREPRSADYPGAPRRRGAGGPRPASTPASPRSGT